MWNSYPANVLNSPSTDLFMPTTTGSPDFDLSNDILDDLQSDQSFDLGSVEQWMNWDSFDPAYDSMSPISELPAAPERSSSSIPINGTGKTEQIKSLRDRTLESSAFKKRQMDSPVDSGCFSDLASLEASTQCSSPHSSSPFSQGEMQTTTPATWYQSTTSPAQPIVPTTDSAPCLSLTPLEESQLLALAMPYLNFPPSPTSISSPEAHDLDHLSHKRKSFTDNETEDDDDVLEHEHYQPRSFRRSPMQRTAHSQIEKRYRTNLNAKIAALRDSIPSLRVTKCEGLPDREVEEDLNGAMPAPKLNKATILTKAIEYVSYLEKQTKSLAQENEQLLARIEAFEMLRLARRLEI